jgi:hypothetical protein
MPAAVTDKFKKGAAAFSTTLASQKASGAASCSLSDATGVPTDTAIDITVGRVDASGNPTPSAKAVYTGTLSGTTVSNLTLVEGTDQTHAAGTVVEITFTANTWNDAVDGILVEHNQDGTHGAVTASSVSTTDLTVTNSPTFTVGGAIYKESKYYTYDGTDIFVNGVDQNNAANTINWTKPTGLKFVVVEVQGGGGGSGGTAVTSAGQGAASGGGGSGGYARKKIAASSLGATETVTVGAAGTAASSGNNAGGTGGNSSFGSHCTGSGGAGGSGGASQAGWSSGGAGGAGGAATGGDLNIAGGDGSRGIVGAADVGIGTNRGANSLFGFGGNSSIQATGTTGKGYGAGGGGTNRWASQGALGGATGSAGIVIVHEYF